MVYNMSRNEARSAGAQFPDDVQQQRACEDPPRTRDLFLTGGSVLDHT